MSNDLPEWAKPDHAEVAFSFLSEHGFRKTSRWVSGGSSSRDGWRVQYESSDVSVSVEYLEWQFDVLFVHKGIRADYLFLDTERFKRRSGFHGKSFPPTKIASVIDQVAMDIRANYEQLLSGDEAEWATVARLLAIPKPAKRLP